jgi:uncharacterized protein
MVMAAYGDGSEPLSLGRAQTRFEPEETRGRFAIVKDFDFETALVLRDDRKNYGEERYRAYGTIKGRLHALVFTRREGRVRVISLRRSNAREIANYAASKKSP